MDDEKHPIYRTPFVQDSRTHLLRKLHKARRLHQTHPLATTVRAGALTCLAAYGLFRQPHRSAKKIRHRFLWHMLPQSNRLLFEEAPFDEIKSRDHRRDMPAFVYPKEAIEVCLAVAPRVPECPLMDTHTANARSALDRHVPDYRYDQIYAPIILIHLLPWILLRRGSTKDRVYRAVFYKCAVWSDIPVDGDMVVWALAALASPPPAAEECFTLPNDDTFTALPHAIVHHVLTQHVPPYLT